MKSSNSKKSRWAKSWWFLGLLLPIISGLIVDRLNEAPVFTTLFNWFNAIWRGLMYQTSTPVWVLILLPFSLLPILLFILWIATSSSSVTQKNYLSEPIFGIKWIPEGIGLNHTLRPIRPLCAHDLRFKRTPPRVGVPVKLHAETLFCLKPGCAFEKDLEVSYGDIHDRVILYVNGEMRADKLGIDTQEKKAVSNNNPAIIQG